MSRTHRIISLGFIFCCFASITAFAGFIDEAGFSVAFESSYWNNRPDDWDEEVSPIYEGPYQSLENTVSFNLDWRNFFAELRIRSMQYEDPIHYDPRSREHETDLELFKFALGYRGEHFKAIAGDFYKSLGKGLILYVQEDKELNLDRTIQGGSLDLIFEPVALNLFAGNIRWYKFKDDTYEKIINEYKINDAIAGGRLSATLPSSILLGASYTAVSLDEVIQDKIESEDLALGEVDFQISGLFGGKLDLYSEYAELKWDSEEPFGNTTEDGKALYTSATMYFGPLTVLAEYKDYDYWDYRYARAPTADRDDELSESVDIRGPRIKLDYFLADSNTLFFISGGRFDNHAHPTSLGIKIRNRMDHVYGGIEQRWDKLYAQITYGYTDYITIDEVHRRITSDIEYKLSDRSSLNLYYELKGTKNESIDKSEHKSYLTYSFSPYFAATIHYNRHLTDNVYLDSDDENWVAGEITATPISALSVSVIVGKLPPGTICSGGQCRTVPAFEGIQASLSYRL